MTAAKANITQKSAPEPRGHFLLGNTQSYLRDPLSFLPAMRREYGDVVHIRFAGGISMVMISHPDGVEHVLQTHQKRYCKGVFQQKLKLLSGEGLVSSESEFWRQQRRLIQPAFHRTQLE